MSLNFKQIGLREGRANTEQCPELFSGLPVLPNHQEISWGSEQSVSLPPTSRMTCLSIVESRLAIHGQRRLNPNSAREKNGTQISIESLIDLGLPRVPVITKASIDPYDTIGHEKVDCDQPHCGETKAVESLSSRGSNFLAQYGSDDAALARVLSATATLIERMSTQSAVDCLMEMPAWMRNTYLARHGVSRIIGLMLSSRLSDAGEASFLSEDGAVLVQNTPAEVDLKLGLEATITKSLKADSRLNTLVLSLKNTRPGVKLKKNRGTIEISPATRAISFHKLSNL